jgi:medium-chain acyl-[acyl-carrier-protein] hydrolase
MPAVWSTSLQICSYDVDVTRRATVPALCRYFLEAAWNHAEALGVGFSHLAAQQRVWVLSRLLVRIERQPDWGERILLNTWPRGTQSLFAMRDFEFLDAGGTLLASGASGWLVLHLETRRPQRLDFLPQAIQNLPAKRALERDPEKLARTDSAERQAMVCTARPSDIDVNAHVNSAKYLDWILDSYPFDIHRRLALKLLEVNYLGETRVGDALKVHAVETEPNIWHHSIAKPGGAEVCHAKLSWTNRTTPPASPAR